MSLPAPLSGEVLEGGDGDGGGTEGKGDFLGDDEGRLERERREGHDGHSLMIFLTRQRGILDGPP